MRYPIPTRPGFYWAKWRLCDDHTDDIEDFKPHINWEIVDVFENHICDDEDDQLRVHVSGVRQSQSLENFVWGLPVYLPKELESHDKNEEPSKNADFMKIPLPAGIPDTEAVRTTLQEFVTHGNNRKTREAIIAKLLLFIARELPEFDAADPFGVMSGLSKEMQNKIVEGSIRAPKLTVAPLDEDSKL